MQRFSRTFHWRVRVREAGPPEKAIQDAILAVLRYHPRVAWVERMNVGATKIGTRFVRFGRPGMCDITGQLKDGRRLEIEVKRPGKKPTPEQCAFIDMVNEAGGFAFVARSIEDVQAALDGRSEIPV